MSNPTKFYITELGLQQPSASDLTDGTTGTGAVVEAASPALTGTPTAPTQVSTDSSTRIATTAFVQNFTNGGVNAQTVSYLAVAGDRGKLISMNGASLTLTLPAAPPSAIWWVAIENTNASSLTISRNGLTIDGSAANLTLTQDQGVFIFTDGSNYFTERGIGTGSGSAFAGGVNSQTVSYLAVSGDNGKLISMNGASLTLTLPAAPPSATWWISVENLNASSLTISRNGLTIDGAAANLTLTQNQGVVIFTDGVNYFTERGMGSAGGSVFAGGVNSQTISYTAVSGDNGELISMNGASLTLTLPAAPPSATWWISVENLNASSLTISRNALTIDGAASDLTLTQNQGVVIFTDGSNYFTERGMGSGGGAVSSVFGRTGAVVSQAGDYFSVIRRRTMITADGSANSFASVIGDVASSSFTGGGTGATANSTTLHGPYWGGNASAGNVGQFSGLTSYTTGRNIRAFFCALVNRVTDTRFWIGVTDQTAATAGASDNPAGNYAAFRFSTVAGDTFWQPITKDGTTQTIGTLLSNVTPVANQSKRFVIIFNDATPNVQFYIDDVLISTITTHLPSATTALRWVTTEESIVSATNNGIGVEQIVIETDY